jgi:hypothetical protein
MNAENEKNISPKKRRNAAKECAFAAVFVALAIVAQLAFSALPGVEIVTVLFCAYAHVFGVKRGMLAATAFSILRQLLFGFFPSVLILYFLYYNGLAAAFGFIGKKLKKMQEKKHETALKNARNSIKSLWIVVFFACVAAVCFALLDCVITPLFYGYSLQAARGYFIASLPVMGAQTACAGITVAILFLPLARVFGLVKRVFL